MKKNYLILLILGLLAASPALATHNRAGEITYEQGKAEILSHHKARAEV